MQSSVEALVAFAEKPGRVATPEPSAESPDPAKHPFSHNKHTNAQTHVQQIPQGATGGKVWRETRSVWRCFVRHRVRTLSQNAT